MTNFEGLLLQNEPPSSDDSLVRQELEGKLSYHLEEFGIGFREATSCLELDCSRHSFVIGHFSHSFVIGHSCFVILLKPHCATHDATRLWQTSTLAAP